MLYKQSKLGEIRVIIPIPLSLMEGIRSRRRSFWRSESLSGPESLKTTLL
jgi:hypothetical protein